MQQAPDDADDVVFPVCAVKVIILLTTLLLKQQSVTEQVVSPCLLKYLANCFDLS